MMSATANRLQKPQRFDLYLRKFRVVCTMHSVEIGSRTNLPGFMQKLMEDRHLAMDFWALVGKLSDREGGELSDDQILAVVVEGVTGSELSDEDAEVKRIVGDLRAMLSGVDIQSPGQGQVEPAPFQRNEASQQELQEGQQQQDDSELRIHEVESPKPSNSRGTSMPGTVAGEATRKAALPTTPPPQLDEEFLRRELTRLVQLYFDSLDKKRSRLEPSVDELAPVANVAGATTARSFEGQDGTDELTLRPMGKSRLVLESTAAAADSDIPIHIPLENYPQPSGYRRALRYVVIALALFEAGFALYQHREPLQREISVMVQDIGIRTGLKTSPNLSAPTAAPVEPAAPANEDSSTLQAKQGQQPAEQPALQSNSPQPLPGADAVNTPTQAASVASQTIGGVDSSSSRKAMADRVAAQAEQISANGITNADLAGAVRVSPSAMEANLVASRVPAYPETAKIEGVEGPVVMQAIISKDGFVKRMHVIQGDTRLRSAATEAVSRWRYRPYILSGQPVEVATTITVDFDLDRR
jgi:TonB family protein